MRVAVQGLWHLGSVTAACLASVGHDVIALDFDEAVIAGLDAGKPQVWEPGLAESIQSGLDSGRLRFTSSAEDLAGNVEILWVTYDTPVDDDDVADVEWVMAQVKRTLPFLADDATILLSSQMPVGSARRLARFAADEHSTRNFSFASSPENLRLGRALDAFLRPDRIVVGVERERDRERIAELLAPITADVEWMSVESAEMTKHAINAFLATSVVFANEIASICEMVGANAKDVERGLRTERRIGARAYVSPGGAFAGGTLARDIEYLREAAREVDVVIPMLSAVRVSNDHHKGWMVRKLTSALPTLEDVPVAVWGMRYKPDTDTLRRSLAVEVCAWLLQHGATLRVHDARVPQLPAEWSGRVSRFDDPLAALAGARVLVIGTEAPEYRTAITADLEAVVTPGLIVLDPNRHVPEFASVTGTHYVAVGSPAEGR
ncbi:UDP-glucose/GDP-mannose dehydrogenase family protein [soil metagenome]